ncbi:MAG: phosphate ABC transporter permease subunit PstC [Spirochaetes bacterium]|nr:phosphate ABC transporter permease subunit PstC [Spirochaetota bacterium]
MKLSAHKIADRTAKYIFTLVGFSSVIFLLLITIFLFKEGLPIFNSVSIKNFLLGTEWYPTSVPPKFGTLPLLAASITVTIVAALIAIPFSLAIAIYLSELAKPAVREIIKPAIELIASIPSVVIGFFGMVVIAPFLQNAFNINTGLNVFNAALMLAFMAVPTIASIAEDALSSVPISLKEGSYALGANRLQTVIFITMPAALSGIWTAIILGLSRVIGETMVVLMVAGGAATFPKSLFDPVRPLTSNIAAEMAEASHQSEHYYALFAIGIILFIFTFIFNLIAHYLTQKYKFKYN